MGGRVNQLTVSGIGRGVDDTEEVMGSMSIRGGGAGGDLASGSVALSGDPCETEVLPDDELPRCDMSEEFENPRRILEFVRE
jgi:hypothetical protein